MDLRISNFAGPAIGTPCIKIADVAGKRDIGERLNWMERLPGREGVTV